MLRQATHPRGFTLMELILVLLMVCTLLAVASPSLRGFTKAARTRDAAENILSLARYAQTQSITRGQTYRLNIDSSARTYWLSLVENGEPQSDPLPELNQQISLPEETQIALERTIGVGLDYIEFRATGRCDAGAIVLTDVTGTTVRVVCDTPIERFRIARPEEAP